MLNPVRLKDWDDFDYAFCHTNVVIIVDECCKPSETISSLIRSYPKLVFFGVYKDAREDGWDIVNCYATREITTYPTFILPNVGCFGLKDMARLKTMLSVDSAGLQCSCDNEFGEAPINGGHWLICPKNGKNLTLQLTAHNIVPRSP